MFPPSRKLARRLACQPRPLHLPCWTLCSLRRASTLALGIRREDPRRIWERRCPLSPEAVAELVAMGVEVQVQHCNRRIWTHDDFRRAGASIVRDVSAADIVVGIKEVPISELPTTSSKEQTHFMFSHTHKGQSYNMPLLSSLLQGARLVDYELLTDRPDRDGKRTIAFGWYAGAAGLVEGLCAYARYLLTLGIATPLLHLPRPFMHPSLLEMRASLNTLGDRIRIEGVPPESGPIIIAVTGGGQVAAGALDMLKELRAVTVQPSELLKLMEAGGSDLHKVYVVHVPAKDYLRRKDGRSYERSDYYENPDNYRSVLHELIAPYVSLLLNGAGWHPGFPRVMSNTELAHAIHVGWKLGPGRLGAIADVTCDLQGGLEFVTETTSIDAPFVITKPPESPLDHPGVHVVSIDILPTELPKDASTYFSEAFMPYLRAFIRQRLHLSIRPEEMELLQAIDRATITQGGRLLPPHEWLYPLLPRTAEKPPIPPSQRLQPKRVLLLGSGMVARPVVETLCQHRVSLVIAGHDYGEASALARNHADVRAVRVDATDNAQLHGLVQKADVVISLLPAPLHPSVAQICIEEGVHLITASYISPQMKALHDRASANDVLLLNECGLDPGIDHCAAVELIRRVEDRGRRIKSFISFCGGLPAPEFSNVPLGYKFSWAPKAVLTAAKNPATFKLEDELFHVPGDKLLQEYFTNVPLFQGFALEGLANRNSLDYVAPYGLGEVGALSSQLRGTLRYKGFSALMSILHGWGLLDETRTIRLGSWDSFLRRSLERITEAPIPDIFSLYSAMTDVVGDGWRSAEEPLRWLGILPPKGVPQRGFYPSLPDKPLSPLELLGLLLSHRLRYRSEERDVVILAHELVSTALSPDACELDTVTHSSVLVLRGDENTSAMARTVGLPVAFAALLVLDGQIDIRGVAGPTHSSIYPSMLRELATAGLVFRETECKGRGIVAPLRSSWTGPKGHQ